MENRRGPIFDPYHVNSVDLGADGNLLVSIRNTWAAYYVSRRSGRVLWTLGGRHSNFKFGRGARFAWQHDVRLAGSSNVSLFDNEATPRVGKQSRGIVLRLDRRAGNPCLCLLRFAMRSRTAGGRSASRDRLQIGER